MSSLIYCVEDDASIRELMVYTLNSTGFSGKGFPNAAEFWSGMKEQLPELILLDIMLPGEDGISILKKLKSVPSTATVPVLMATARGSEYDKVLGLDLGADDYLAKPFGMMEMVSRIRAVLRRAGPVENRSVLSAFGITVDKSRHKVSAGDREVALTLKEYDLLLLLMENPGRVFTRDRLLDSVWQSGAGLETRTVDVHVGTLRTKLGSAGSHVQTVRGVGYRWEDAVE